MTPLETLSVAFHDELEKIAASRGMDKVAILGAITGAATAKKDKRWEGAGKGFVQGDLLGGIGGRAATFLGASALAGALRKGDIKAEDAIAVLAATEAAGTGGAIYGGYRAGKSTHKK